MLISDTWLIFYLFNIVLFCNIIIQRNMLNFAILFIRLPIHLHTAVWLCIFFRSYIIGSNYWCDRYSLWIYRQSLSLIYIWRHYIWFPLCRYFCIFYKGKGNSIGSFRQLNRWYVRQVTADGQLFLLCICAVIEWIPSAVPGKGRNAGTFFSKEVRQWLKNPLFPLQGRRNRKKRC